MNELERLIAGVERPAPSTKLDDRVHALFAREPLRPRRFRWHRSLMSCASAACIGMLGFYFGRQSVVAVADVRPAAASASGLQPAPESAPDSANVMRVPLPADQLAGLFVPRGGQEGLLGKGPVRIETFTSP
jgi:hypothetical protein